MIGEMKRVVIIGNGGAGKSTLARQLGAALHVDVTHLDSVYWKPHWLPMPESEMNAAQKHLVAREGWIIEGQFKHTLDAFLQAADMIIFLDFPLLLCLYRILRRHLRYAGRSRPELGEEYPEILTLNFVWRVLKFSLYARAEVLKKIDQYAQGQKVIILRTPQQVKRFLSKFPISEQGIQ
jgi:adenylate kinase family enzyme